MNAALAVGLVGEAQAVPFTYRIAHEVFLDKTDDILAPQPPNGDDFFQVNGTYRVRSGYVELRQGGAIVDSGYTTDDGEIVLDMPPPGPTPVSYKLRLYGRHDIDGRWVHVYQDEGDPLWAYAETPTFDPWYGTPLGPDVVFDAAVPGNEWINVAAVASWVVWRRTSAFPAHADNGAVYQFAMDDPGAGNAGVYNAETQFVRIWDDHSDGFWRLKHVIAHELGHALQHWANYPGTGLLFPDYAPEKDYTLSDPSCPSNGSHAVVSVEHQSAALHEGFASFVSAVAFNRTTEGDCRIVPQADIEWYDDAPGVSPLAYSCEGASDGDPGGAESYFTVGGTDYLHEVHGFAPNDVACTDTAPSTHVAVELDWERTLWDLVSKQGLTFGQLVTVYDQALPESWASGINAQWSFRTQLFWVSGNSHAAWNAEAPRNGVAQ